MWIVSSMRADPACSNRVLMIDLGVITLIMIIVEMNGL